MMRGIALRPSWPYVSEVARSLLGILLAVAVALEFGSGGMAAAAGGSAAICGAVALQDSPRRRLAAVSGAAVVLAGAVLLGVVAGAYAPALIVVVVLWCVAAGMVWAVSSNAGLVAAAGGALLVTCAAGPIPVTEGAWAALLALGGGLTQLVFVAAWPRQVWRSQRESLSQGFALVAADARDLAGDPAASPNLGPLMALRDKLAPTERQARRRPPAHRGLYALPERIAMTLDALGPGAGDPRVRELLESVTVALDAVASGDRATRGAADAELDRAGELLPEVPPAAVEPAARLVAQVREAAALRFAETVPPVGSLRAGAAAVAAQLAWSSPIMRHALRLGLAAGTGVAISAVAGLQQGYWIVLTVMMVLRPETAHTYTRCVIRVLGGAAGVTAATAITVLLHPSGLVSGLLAALAVAGAYAVSGLGYVPLAGALAAAIVFLVDIEGAAPAAALRERLIAVLLGGALAVAGHVVLPDRSLVRLRQRAGELLKAEIDYAATVVKGFVHRIDDPDATLTAAWQRAIRARSAFEAASGGLRTETPQVRHWLTSYRAGLNAVTGACASLEAQLPEVRQEHLDQRFVVAVDDYIDALRGAPPCPGQAWSLDTAHLTEAEQQLRDSASLLGKQDTPQRVLVSEVETITRHLLSVAAQTP
ncbi:FUSC family protein [Mycolicibacterium palauense]|uniref:FUSC family protein n=1 Tax=Mycolicibacterium palauense TaxID=2034511 RepID=UPI00114541DB|nr:FUSC family protein [Mycolicibacterium palauense]